MRLATKCNWLSRRRFLDSFGTHFDVWYTERSLHLVRSSRARLGAAARDGPHLRIRRCGLVAHDRLRRRQGPPAHQEQRRAHLLCFRQPRTTSTSARVDSTCASTFSAPTTTVTCNGLRTVAACAGDDPDYNIAVLIGQLVKILKGGVEIRLSKRAGEIVTLQEFVDMAGVDAVRYSLARYPSESPLTLDIDVITRKTNDNPVFYVQYAHARIASLLRNATELGIARGELDASLLNHEREVDLLGTLAEFPRVVASAAELREPHRVARYLEELAGVYHRFYDVCRVRPARRRRGHRSDTRAAVAVRSDPHRAGERPWPAGCQHAGADVVVHSHVAGALHADAREPITPPPVAPADVNALDATVWSSNVTRSDAGVLTIAGVAATDLARDFELRRTWSTRPTPCSLPCLGQGLSRCRCLLRGKALLTIEIAHWVSDEGLGSTCAPVVSWPSRFGPGSSRAASPCTATTSRCSSCAPRSMPAWVALSSTPSRRSNGWRYSPRGERPDPRSRAHDRRR